MSPLAALLNHSCDPNVSVVFPRYGTSQTEPGLNVVAMQDIPPGAEVSVILYPRYQMAHFLNTRNTYTAVHKLYRHNAANGTAPEGTKGSVQFHV